MLEAKMAEFKGEMHLLEKRHNDKISEKASAE